MSYVTYEQAKLDQKEIISDYFDDDLGQWSNYRALDVDQTRALVNQKHTDLRSFYSDKYKNAYIIDLSFKNMTDLQNNQVQSINAPILIKSKEPWTGGSNTIDDAGTWRALKFSCDSTNPVTVYSKTSPIDINQYKTDGYITFAFPNIPSLLTSACSVSLTTDTTSNGFIANQTNTFTFDDTENITLTTTNGNAELKILTSKLTNIFSTSNSNKGLITGIKFVIQLSPNSTGYFYCSAIRCVSSNWSYAPLDINTLENKVVKTVPPNGALPKSTLNAALHSIATITSATWSDNEITFVTNGNHGFSNNDSINISNISPSGYNGQYTIIYINPNSFKVSKNNDPGITTDITRGIAQPAIISVYNSSDFPDSGIVLVNNKEYIRYTSKTTNALTGTLERGLFNSPITDHLFEAEVVLHNFNYPVNSIGSKLPTQWPVIFRTFSNSNQLIGSEVDDLQIKDPKPIGGSVYAVINTGPKTGTGVALADSTPNIFSFYFRNGIRSVTQYELNKQTQSNLNALSDINSIVSKTTQGTQGLISKIPGTYPNYQLNVENSSPQDGLSQAELSTIPGTYASSTLPSPLSGFYQKNNTSSSSKLGKSQLSIEQVPGNAISYLATHLRWFKNNQNLTFEIVIGDELSSLFTFTVNGSLSYWQNNKTFVFKSTVLDNTVECKLFELKNNQLYLIYTTNRIESNFFHTTEGTFGWTADLKDGSTKIDSVRSNQMIYGEYRSSVMNSITPVKGAQIFANQTKEKELITEDLKSNQWTTNTGALSAQIDNTNIKNPIKIYTINDSNNGIWQGIETNEFEIENFENIYVNFDIKYLSNNKIIAFFHNKENNTLFELNVPFINKGQWQSIKLFGSSDSVLPGKYTLVIVEDGYNNNNSWSIKNVSVKQRIVNWEMRSFVDGPWEIGDRDWIKNHFINLIPTNDFTKTINSSDGVMFTKQDTELQLRAQALNPYVEISHFEVKPKYATPGNFIWKD